MRDLEICGAFQDGDGEREDVGGMDGRDGVTQELRSEIAFIAFLDAVGFV